MCQFSATAEDTRDAQVGEDLTVTQSPHDGINWVTEPGVRDVAVCILPGTVLAVEIVPGQVRGARFEEVDTTWDHRDDSIVFLDGGCERLLLYRVPLGTKIQVLQLPRLAVESLEVAAGSNVPESELVAAD